MKDYLLELQDKISIMPSKHNSTSLEEFKYLYEEEYDVLCASARILEKAVEMRIISHDDLLPDVMEFADMF